MANDPYNDMINVMVRLDFLVAFGRFTDEQREKLKEIRADFTRFCSDYEEGDDEG